MFEFVLEGLLRGLGALVRALLGGFFVSVLPWLLHWSPARLLRVRLLGHDPADTGEGFGVRLLWGAVDLASWVLLLAVIGWLVRPGVETIPPVYGE